MKQIRPHRRPVRSARQRSDDYSGEVLKTVIIGLLIVVALMAFYSHSKRQLVSTRAPSTEDESAIGSAPDEPRRGQAPPEPRPAYYTQPAAPRGPTGADISRYNSLQDYCYRMARMNATGEYPSMQRTACRDYQQFALSVGLDPGALPVVREQSTAGYPPAQAQSRQQADNASPNQWECASLEQQKEWINARTRQALTSEQTERYRQDLRLINARMWDLNCRNH
jgi:hypothetical protein